MKDGLMNGGSAQVAQAMRNIEGMRCDGGSLVMIGCLNPVKWGVRVCVPSRTQAAPGHRQIHYTLELHACDAHKEAGCFTLDRLLDSDAKARIEAFAKATRPIDFRPDFDAAFLDWIDVFSPLYQAYAAAWHAHAETRMTEAFRSPQHPGGK